MSSSSQNTFTAHNIRLDDGSLTRPEHPLHTMEDVPLLRFSKQFLRMLFPEGFAGKRIVDLGCLEGGYSVEFARAGFEALGIDVRQSNIANCRRVKEGTSLPNLNFAQDDVWNLVTYGIFDAAFCCGLLYHLDQPRRFIELVAQVCRRVAIIDTHVASTERNRVFQLSEVTQNEGLSGRWYDEPNDEVRHESKWASWDNQKSFWPMKRDLIKALHRCGFTMIVECPIDDQYLIDSDRVTIVAVKD